MKRGGGWYHEEKRDPLRVKTAVADLETGTPAMKHFTLRNVASPRRSRIVPYLQSYSPIVSVIYCNICDSFMLRIFILFKLNTHILRIFNCRVK
jgi:hypothetical protein